MTFSRREFLLSAAATGATALAAKVALEHPDTSRLVLGAEAMREYNRVTEQDQSRFPRPFVRVDLWNPKTSRWLRIVEVPVMPGEAIVLDQLNIASSDDCFRASLFSHRMFYAHNGSVRV